MAHLYWRILENTSTSQGALSAAEISMAATNGGANQCTGGTAFASSTYGGYPASNAFDGDPSTFWSSNGNSIGVYIGYQFASPVDVVELVILPRPDYLADGQGFRNFSLQYSDDGVTYTTAATFDAATWSVGVSQTFDTYIPGLANVTVSLASLETLTALTGQANVVVSLSSIEALTALTGTANVVVASTLVEVLTPVYAPTVSSGGWVTVIS